MSKIYFDSETCGLAGPAILLQYAIDDGPVILHDIWRSPIVETLELIEEFMQHDIIGFNLSFDIFQLCKLYTTFIQFKDLGAYPEDHIDELAILEESARRENYCLKPKRACDLMLLARRGPYQSLMGRDDIKITKVPTALAWELAKELEKRIFFDQIYFAKAKDKFAPKWKVFDRVTSDGSYDPDFKDIKLRFRASGSLKNLYRHVFKEQVTFHSEIEVDRKFWPNELGYAPFALAIGKSGQWNHSWPEVIKYHIRHWGFNSKAREYASNDINYTRRLYLEHFNSPEPGDTDSELACMVGACRWRGYNINLEILKDLKTEALNKIKNTPIAPRVAKIYLEQVMSPLEQLITKGSTKRVVLEEIATWEEHPAATRAKEILDARMAAKEVELYNKLLLAKRFHASFIVIGTLSSRMSGSDKLNPQGIKHQNYVRRAFTLADPEYLLCGGDFKSFEVSIAATVFQDPKLDAALKEGSKIHALFGMELFPGKSYQEILDSEGTNDDLYDKGKKGIFAIFYGGEAYTLMKRLGIAEEAANSAYLGLLKRFPGIAKFGEKVANDFGALSQPNGLGSKVIWKEPADYAESFLGFRRYFTLENKITRLLFELAQEPPKQWRNLKIKVIRRDREQTASGAIQSALFGAAFGIQQKNIRAAKNHYIQSPGAEITKSTQRAIWDIQPSGINDWIVQPMNIHDEIMNPTKPGNENRVETAIKNKVNSFKAKIPLIAIDWFNDIPNWADKKGSYESRQNQRGLISTTM